LRNDVQYFPEFHLAGFIPLSVLFLGFAGDAYTMSRHYAYPEC
jgi:hypothetical protein